MRTRFLNDAARQLDSQHVKVDVARAASLEPDFGNFTLPRVFMPFEARGPVREVIPFLLAMNSLQYRFWEGGDGSAFRRYTLAGNVGSAAMMLGFERAWGDDCKPGEGIQDCLTSVEAVSRYFGDIPDPQSRSDILKEVLTAPHLSEVVQALDSALIGGEVGIAQAQLIAEAFPVAYGDSFLKKAQLALGLMVAEYRSTGVLVNESLCAYADYQVPRVLYHLGVLQYSPELAHRVHNRLHLAKDGPEERSIRAASVLACDAIAAHFQVSAAEVDWWLWLQRNTAWEPFHLTMTTAY